MEEKLPRSDFTFPTFPLDNARDWIELSIPINEDELRRLYRVTISPKQDRPRRFPRENRFSQLPGTDATD